MAPQGEPTAGRPDGRRPAVAAVVGAGQRIGARVAGRAGLWPAGFARARAWLRAEAGAGRLLPWLPVALGAGIALYFAAPREPLPWAAAAVAVAGCAAAFALRRSRAFAALALIAAALAGFAAASGKAARIAHPVLTRPAYAASLSGFVETREARERTDRFVLRVTAMEAARTPALTRVRLSVKKGTAPAVGSHVTLKARLLPPLQPLRPGGYDFARDLYFQGIGASGFAMGAIAATPAPEPSGGWLGFAAAIERVRGTIDSRIAAVLTGDARAIATALLTGRRDALAPSVNDALFVSGLGHILSISGYHMAVVAGLVFFAVRALLALIPPLAASAPIKKVAAVAALAAATAYLALSGAEVATQRSYIMTAVVLIAVIVDRRAVTFRTLALAALAVLVLAPEALVHPSFQMSFAATLGLVALVQHGLPLLYATPEHGRTARLALWGGREIAMLALASLVAGAATLPYAAYHFHRITPYGVLANLAAMPVVSGVVMPAGLLGLVAAPFGFDGLFWKLMGLGIAWMIAVSQWVAALPAATVRVPAFGVGPLIAASLGIVLLGLLRSPLRYGGVALLALATAGAASTPQPDVTIAGDGRSVGVRGRDGRLHVMQRGRDAFLLREWLAADADGRAADDTSLGEGVSCDGDGCVTALRGGALVALALRNDAMADDCARAAIVVTAWPAPADCPALVLDAAALAQSGALALRMTDDVANGERRFRRDAVQPAGTLRPWSPTAGIATPVSRPQRAPRPVDATPAASDREADGESAATPPDANPSDAEPQ